MKWNEWSSFDELKRLKSKGVRREWLQDKFNNVHFTQNSMAEAPEVQVLNAI